MHIASGPAARCWASAVAHSLVQGHALPPRQQYHPHRVAAELWWCGRESRPLFFFERCLQWNVAGFTQAKRLTSSKKLCDEGIAFRLLSESTMSLHEAAGFWAARVSALRDCSHLSRWRRFDPHPRLGLQAETKLTLSSVCLPPASTKTTAEDFDKLLSCPALRALRSPTHSCADFGAAQPLLIPAMISFRSGAYGERLPHFQHGRLHKRFTDRHGGSTPDVTPSKDYVVRNWISQPSPDSDHYTIMHDVLLGDGGTPVEVPRPSRSTLAWWNPHGRGRDPLPPNHLAEICVCALRWCACVFLAGAQGSH